MSDTNSDSGKGSGPSKLTPEQLAEQAAEQTEAAAVVPGFGGQGFMRETLTKVKEALAAPDLKSVGDGLAKEAGEQVGEVVQARLLEADVHPEEAEQLGAILDSLTEALLGSDEKATSLSEPVAELGQKEGAERFFSISTTAVGCWYTTRRAKSSATSELTAALGASG